MALSITATGTFFSVNNGVILRGYGGLKSEVSNFQEAIEAGVKFFDGAYAYKDGAKLAEALAGKDVKQFVLSSKIPGFELEIDNLRGSTEACFQKILERRGVEYVDILYLHGPDVIHKEVLDTLVKLQEQGRIGHIGLCNVNVETLKALVDAGYPISVVQNEVNPFYWDEEVMSFCRSQEIAIVGYRPFGDKKSAEIFENQSLIQIAQRVNGSVQDVIQQWMNQKGVTPIPHSNSLAHIERNLVIPEWTLSEAEMKEIDGIKKGKESTCGWQKFLNADLLAKSKQWIDRLVESKI